MGRNSKDVYDADGSTSLLSFVPEKLQIVTDKAHPLYDERATLPLDDAMVKNIMTFGVLEPVIITRDPETGDKLVVDGRQRVRHAVEANIRLAAAGLPTILVPATTRKGDDGGTLMAIMVATNEIRQADPVMVRAAKMQRMKNLGQDDEAVALAFGVNKLTVQNTLALLDCSKPVQKAVEGQYIGITDVRYLSRLTPAQQTAKVEEIVRATAGKEGHARAKAKREVLEVKASPDAKPAAPKMKGRKEIAAQIEHWRKNEPDTMGAHGYILALQWVLGDAATEPEKDTKTGELFEGVAA